MPTIAELQIKIDSSPIDQGTKSLNDFAVAAEKASTATDKKRKSDEGLADASKRTSTEVDNTAKAAEKQNKEFEALLGKIDPLTKKLNDLAKQEAALFANKNNLSTGAFDAYNAKLQESFDKLMGVSVAQKSVADSSSQVPERLQNLAKAAYDNASAQEKLTDAFRGASEAEQGLVSSGAVDASNRRAAAAMEEYNAKRRLTESTNSVTSAQKNQSQGLEELLTKIDPTVRKMNELDQLQKQLNSQKASGNLEPELYDRFTQTIDRNRASLQRYSDGLQNTGKSAKELAFATRGLPAQFTDIVVSLQGGQAPLTVLLQQGGQIKDMFGGIVPALKAMGTALIAMVTPVTVVATGITALGFAAYSGSQELTDFNKAVIASAGFAGVSSSQFASFRNTLSDTGLNAGKAAEAMTELARGGQVAGELFTRVSQSVILFEKATGQALSKTIEDFNAIGKDPVDAAVRLDEKYKFLTASILEQASALQRNGQESEAAELLQARLSDQVTKTAQNMIEQAGYIERAWNGVKGSITGVWDELKGIGRESTSTDRIVELNRQRKNLQEAIDLNANLGLKGFGQQGNIDRVAQIDKEIVQIKQRSQYEQLLAEQRSKEERDREEAVSAQSSSLKRYETSLKGVEKAENELRKVRLENSKIRNGGEAISASQSEIMVKNEARAVEELKKEKEKAGKTKTTSLDTRAVTEVKNNLNELTAEYDGYYKNITALGQAGIVSQEATFNSQKALLEAEKTAISESYDEQIAAINKLRDNKKNSASQNISLDNQLSKAESARVVSLEKIDSKLDSLQTKEQGRLEQRTRNISAYKAALDAQLESLRDEGARAADGVGKGDAAAEIARKLAENDRSFDKQQRQLSKSLGEGMDPTEYAEKLKDLKDTHTEMTEQILKNNKDIQDANADWTNGFSRALENSAADGRNFARATENVVSGAFDSMGDALATFVTTGKLDFRSLAVSIIADMAKIAAKQAASSALSSLFGLAMTLGSAYFGGGATGAATAGAASTGASNFASQFDASSASVTFPQAKGGAWDAGAKFYAKGGAFTNSIVSSPTAFSTNSGANGIMGEAGPEAIVPLSRAADGSLGVKMTGMGGGDGSSGVVVYVTISNEGSSSETSDSNYAGFGKEIGNLIETKYRQLQARDLSAGGDLRRAINER